MGIESSLTPDTVPGHQTSLPHQGPATHARAGASAGASHEQDTSLLGPPHLPEQRQPVIARSVLQSRAENSQV
jgi:hypothetical protein